MTRQHGIHLFTYSSGTEGRLIALGRDLESPIVRHLSTFHDRSSLLGPIVITCTPEQSFRNQRTWKPNPGKARAARVANEETHIRNGYMSPASQRTMASRI